MKRRSSFDLRGIGHEDPLNGMSNILDVALVFIVGLFLALMSTYQLLDLFNPASEVTVVKQSDGQMTLITKKGKEIKVSRLTDHKIGDAEGMRLGTAYRLKDGRVIYVPEGTAGE